MKFVSDEVRSISRRTYDTVYNLYNFLKLGPLIHLTSHHWIFLWGTLKGIAYEHRPTTSEEILQSVINECGVTNPQEI
jgi:hypothetical protein